MNGLQCQEEPQGDHQRLSRPQLHLGQSLDQL